MSLQKDKTEHLLQILLALLKILIVIQQFLCILKITVMMFIQLLWLENTFALVYIIFNIRLVNHVFLISIDNPVKNVIAGVFSKTKNPRDFYIPIEDVFEIFLINLQPANDF